MIRARRLQHVVLNVTDLDASVKFYEAVLGLEVVARQEEPAYESAAAFLSCGADHHNLALFQRAQGAPPDNSPPGMSHSAWQLDNCDELLAAYEELLEKGFDVHRTIQHNVTNSIYLKDPDGLVVELFCDRFEDGLQVMKTVQTKSDHLDIRTGEVTPARPKEPAA